MTEKSVLGRCVFLTWAGLQAEGNGLGESLFTDGASVEFREPAMGGVDYFPRSDKPLFFVRVLKTAKSRIYLAGHLQLFADSAQRPGFFGSGVFFNSEGAITDDLLSELDIQHSKFSERVADIQKSGNSATEPGMFHRSDRPVVTLTNETTGPPKVFSNPKSKLSAQLLKFLVVYLDQIDHRSSTIILGFGEDTRFVPFSPNDIADAREERKKIDQQRADALSRQRDRQDAILSKRYAERRAKIKALRPDFVDPGVEEYLIQLILYVLRAKNVIKPEENADDHLRQAQEVKEQLSSGLLQSFLRK